MHVRERNFVVSATTSNISNDIIRACQVSLQDATVGTLNVDISQLMFIGQRDGERDGKCRTRDLNWIIIHRRSFSR